MNTNNNVYYVPVMVYLAEGGQKLTQDLIDAAGLKDEKAIVAVVDERHITIGVVEGLSREQADRVSKIAKEYLEICFRREEVKFVAKRVEGMKFSKHTAIEPTEESTNALLQLNVKLNEALEEKGFPLNWATKPGSYVPHVTLINYTTGPGRVGAMDKKLEEQRKGHWRKEVFFKLQEGVVKCPVRQKKGGQSLHCKFC